MTLRQVIIVLLLGILLLLAADSAAGQNDFIAGDLPDVYGWDRRVLAENRARILAGDEWILPAYEQLLADAERALTVAPVSVVDKEQLPPSGDKHDYLSIAIYYWPNPDTADGLPWVNRDGERNPTVDEIPDKPNNILMQRTVETLALAFYFSGEERYAAHAAAHLRHWFLDPATRMNPHLEYAQGVPGRHDGSCYGIIDTAQLGYICDCASLLAPSPGWTDAEQLALQQWFADYVQWLTESANGRAEGATSNNHGVWYDAQVARYALFSGDHALAWEVLSAAGERRIAAQIKPDGRQPHELKRTKSWDYSIYNLQAFVRLAILGEALDIDLWNYESVDGAGIRPAFEFLIPYAKNPDDWQWKQIKDWHNQGFARLLLTAADSYDEPGYRQLALELGDFTNPASRDRLLYRLE